MTVRYATYWSSGIKFLFAYDAIDPTLLHIYARHLVDPLIAIKVWWEGKFGTSSEIVMKQVMNLIRYIGSGSRKIAKYL